MSVAGYVTLGNISCNLCRNKIARQVAREIAQCNSALSRLRTFDLAHRNCYGSQFCRDDRKLKQKNIADGTANDKRLADVRCWPFSRCLI